MNLYPDISSLPQQLLDPGLSPQLKQLAIDAYPEEFCALILHDGSLVPLQNAVRGDEANSQFTIDPHIWITYESDVLAVVHSHPNGPASPTAADMLFQIENDKIMGLMVCGKSAADQLWASDPFWWGPGVPLPPLIGRGFRHGPSATDGKGDCYACIKDFYQIHRNVTLPEFPRDWEWWTTTDLYTEGFPQAGFRPIRADEARPGDVFLATIRSQRPNHGGILWDSGSILHHLVDRLSGRTAYGPWNRQITHWLRHEDDLPPWDPRA